MTFNNIAIIFLLYIIIVLPAVADNKTEISLTIAINEQTYLKYKLKYKKNVCEQLPNLKKTQVDRPLVELFIICSAFQHQNITLNIKLVATKNYERALWLIKHGYVDVFAQTAWGDDIERKYMHASIDIIREGEFNKGIYTHENHELQKTFNNSTKLSNYVGIVPKAWHQDLAVMKELTPNILENNYYPAIFKLIARKRADFTLMEFPTKNNLSYFIDGYYLKPIQGIKIMIPTIRKFIVSKKVKKHQYIFEKMNTGLQTMREKGEIRQIYLNSGFINIKTQSWQIVNSHQL